MHVIHFKPWIDMTEEQKEVAKEILKLNFFRVVPKSRDIPSFSYDDVLLKFVYNQKLLWCVAHDMDSKSIMELRKESSDFNLFNEIGSNDEDKDEELEKIIYKHKRRKIVKLAKKIKIQKIKKHTMRKFIGF